MMSDIITIRVKPEEKQLFRERATAERLSLSTFIVKSVLGAMENESS